MTHWIIRWKSATGAAYDGPPIGCFTDRRDAEAALLNQVRAAADALEHGTGKAGEWTWDTTRQVATLYRGDFLDETPIGRYIIEQVAPDSREK